MDLLAPVGTLLSEQLDLIREIGRNIAGEGTGPPLSSPQTAPADTKRPDDARLPQGPSPSTATLQDERAIAPANRQDAAATLIGLRRPASEPHLPGRSGAALAEKMPGSTAPGVPGRNGPDLPVRSGTAVPAHPMAGTPAAGSAGAGSTAASPAAVWLGGKGPEAGGSAGSSSGPEEAAGRSRGAGATGRPTPSFAPADGTLLAAALHAASDAGAEAAAESRLPGEVALSRLAGARLPDGIANASALASSPSDHTTDADAARQTVDDGQLSAPLRGNGIDRRGEPAMLAALLPAEVQRALAGSDLQGGSAMLERALASFALTGGMAAGAMPERAGILASFILNAHFLPGWPPPRPIQQPEAKAFVQQLAPGGKLTQNEIEMLEYLANLGFTRKQVARLMKLLRKSKDRSRLLEAISAFFVTLGVLVTMLQEEVEALAEELRAGDRLAQQTAAGKRARIELR